MKRYHPAEILFCLLAAVLLTTGVALISIPAGLIVAGGLALAAGLLPDYGR